jgi:hypothetical protein
LVLGNALGKAVYTPAFSHKSKVAFPKTEVLGKQPPLIILTDYGNPDNPRIFFDRQTKKHFIFPID